MVTATQNTHEDFTFAIGRKDGKEWDKAKIARMKELAKKLATGRTPERKLKNELMAIRFTMEEYVEGRGPGNKQQDINSFLSAYLRVLNLTFKKFAQSIDTTDGNLKKYVSGERKFNTDLAMKFGHFFHTTPEIWLKVQLKNELDALKLEKKKVNRYKKYNFEKVI